MTATHRPNVLLAAISRHIDESPAYQGISPEAADWRRTTKMVEEVGEAITAYAGTLGENPRKGVTHTPADVDHEVLDVAVSALGALMHRHGNNPEYDVMGALAEHIRTRAARFGIVSTEETPKAPPAQYVAEIEELLAGALFPAVHPDAVDPEPGQVISWDQRHVVYAKAIAPMVAAMVTEAGTVAGS